MTSQVRYRDEPATTVFSGLGVGSGFYVGCGVGVGKTFGAFYVPSVQLSVGVGCGLQVGFGWGFFLYGWGACIWSLRSMLGIDERDVANMLQQLRRDQRQESPPPSKSSAKPLPFSWRRLRLPSFLLPCTPSSQRRMGAAAGSEHFCLSCPFQSKARERCCCCCCCCRKALASATAERIAGIGKPVRTPWGSTEARAACHWARTTASGMRLVSR